MDVNPVAAAGFGRAADAYERSRPSYPTAAVDRLCTELGIAAGTRVLDLAAGTGKLTRLLAERGADLVAVEPSEAMRRQFALAVPGVPMQAGTAEAIPLADASVDGVVVAQAFHWFDAPRALAEIARVLRVSGGLGLVWNERDESVEWVAELSHVMRWDVQMPYRVGTDFREVLDGSGRFTSAQRERFRFSQNLDRDGLCERVSTTSFIASMEPAEREHILDGVRALVADFPDRFELPYVTEVFWCHEAGKNPST
ncbi:MAG TPA: methyltransferase domain-containing protein [Acidimicrobiia bacterium]|nr:methyltransferase domain-containing protein [Acidimicrobiia bacterium]